MKLKQKILLLISASFLIFLILVGMIVKFALLNSYNRIETSFIINNLNLIHNDIKESSENLSRQLGDWSKWDDTYNYVIGEYPEYLEDNMMDGTFTNLKLNFIWMCDISGNKLYSKFFDLTSNKEIPFSNSINSYLENNSFLIKEGINMRSINGIVKIDDMPFIFSSHAITKSIGDSEPVGIMVMGILINKQWLTQHSEKLNLPLNIYNIEDVNLSDLEKEAIIQANNGISNVISMDNPEIYIAYTTIKDIKGKNILLVKTTGPRTIFNIGRISLLWFMGALLILMLILAISFKFVADRLIIKRLNYIGNFIIHFKSENNTQKHIEVRGNDEIANLIEEINDMFERILISNRQLLEAKEEAEYSSKSKSEFLRNMSHELRTPLNHIIGFSQLMKDGIPGPVNDTQKEYLEDVLSSSSHLLSLINDLLDLSRIESGKAVLTFEALNINNIILETMEMYQTNGKNRQLMFIFNNGSLPETIMADKRMIIQILHNLISNAVKFTVDKGNITIVTESKKKEIIVSIKDTGIGLEANSMDKIFESFSQVEADLTRKFEGTGLGLALTKNLVELHGGRIWAESCGLGKGSTFTFTLPIIEV
jgi:signal transduction histidine kinase